MSFFHSNEKKTGQVRNHLVSSSELHAAFDKEREDLLWLALVITGDADLAKQSVVNASELSSSTTGVFRDWLVHWAHSATARVAAEAIRADIFAAAATYSNWNCPHREHELLLPGQAALLRRYNALRIASALDPLQRSVLVLRGIQHASVSNCALLLDVPRGCVLGAYCSVLQWVHQQEEATTAHPLTEQEAADHSQDKIQTDEIRESYPSKGIFQHVRTAIGPCNS